MTRLYLLRHGETLSNLEQRYQGQGDSPLSDLGRSEAQELSKALRNEDFSAVYCSTLARSRQTAAVIAEQQGLTSVGIDDLKERFYGEWESLTFTDIKAKYKETYELWLERPNEARIPGAESLSELQERGVRAVEGLIEKHKGRTICVVGHGGINRTILFHYMRLDLDNFWRIKQDNCCVNIIEFGRAPAVLLLNSTWFLGEKRVKGSGYY